MEAQHLVVSDLHLTDIENHANGWKRYKGDRYVFDGDFADLLARFAGTADNLPRVLVLNGDIVDFDLITAVPRDESLKVSPGEKRRGLRPTAPRSLWKLQRILEHHPQFLDALADFLVAGHRLVYVLGNHDREMHFPLLQEYFLSTLQQRAASKGASFQTSQVTFEPWFYYVPGVLYVEHGNQYDYYSSFRYVLSPTIRMGGEEQITIPMGNISNRYLLGRMGYFNPHSNDFILNMYSYLTHWLRYYAFSRRYLLINWFVGSILVMAELIRIKPRLHRPPKGYTQLVEETARRNDLTLEQVERLTRLQPVPIHNRMYRVLREFWIDRLLMAILMTGGTVALALMDVPLWVKLMVPLTAFPLAYFVYETIVSDNSVFGIVRQMPGYAKRVAALLDVPVVLFGHTHVPRLLPLSQGKTFVDTGTWAPMTRKNGDLLPGYRNYAIVTSRTGTSQVQLDCWRDVPARMEAQNPVLARFPGRDTQQIAR